MTFADNAATGPTDIYVHAPSYPDGWLVEASDADTTWSQAFDPTTRVLSVTTTDTGGHAHDLRPPDRRADRLCRHAVAPVDPTGPVDPGALPTAPPAVPVPGRPAYTG